MKKFTREKAQVTGALIAAHTTFERRHGSFSQRNGKIRAMGVTALAAATFLPALVHAQNNVATPYEAAAAYNAFNQNFLVQSGGLTYYNCELNSVGDNNCGGYGEALSIQVCEDNWDATHSQAAQTLVNSMLTTFDNTQGALWSGDGWNDDVGWMVAAYIHGYWATGNSTWLTIAENNWNLVYNRGWSTQLGGGIYETTDNQDKEGLSNNPFIWEGVQLYEATGDTTYLTKAEAIYAWVRSNLFNATNSNNAVGVPGRLIQGEEDSGALEGTSGSASLYNQGAFLEAAANLYHVTGNSEYYNDAVLDINYTMGNEPIMSNNSEDGGAQWAYWFIRGLHDFCDYTNTWSTYYPYLLANANQEWQERNNLNLTWNQWTAPTNDSGTNSTVMSSGAGIWQLLTVPQQYQIVNKNSGLAMDLIAYNESNLAPINQWSPTSGDSDQAWSVIPLSNGNYAIISGLTGMAASIQGASTSNGAQLVDWPFSLTDNSMQYKLISEGGGWYEIQNVNSGLVLDDDANGTTNGTTIIQYAANGQNNQLWELVPVTSFSGTYQIQSASSNQCLDVTGLSETNGAAVIQYPYGGGANQKWTFVPTSMGYYEIVNVNSGQQLNVDDNSYSDGADICQWPGGNEASDQWLPAQNSNGTWTFYNLNSGLVLDNPGGTTQGAQFDQWVFNGGTNQQFTLISE